MRKHHFLSLLLLFVMFGLVSFFLISTSASPNPISTSQQFLSPLPTPTRIGDLPSNVSKEEQIALEYVAEVTNTPVEKLYVGAPAYVTLIETGYTLWQANVSEINTDNAQIVTIDLDTDKVVDGAALIAQEQETHLEKYGKFEPALYERLQSAAPNDLLSISVWFSGVDIEKIRSEIFSKYPDMGLIEFRPGPNTDLKLYDQVFQEATAAETKAYQEQAQSIVDLIETNGGKMLYVSQQAPMVFAEVTKELIQELAVLDKVEMLYLSEPVKMMMDNVVPTDRVKAVWDRGNNGSGMNGNSGVKVAIVEWDGIDFNHPDLANGTYFDSVNTDIALDNGHATAMAGIVASTHPTIRGVAYGAPALYSANSGTLNVSDIIAATDGAIAADSRVLNHSFGSTGQFWGSIGDFARYYDHVVRYKHRTIAQSSGNESGGHINDGAAAFNVITIGGINESNSSQWSDDTIWDDPNGVGSAYKNPLDGREKPEVAAVAKDVTTTGLNNGFLTGSGTSAATAQVAGLAALLMSRNNTLKDWPEAVKAIVMASAVHNVDGGSALVSDKDGVGSIDVLLADTIVQNNWWTTGSIATSVSENNYYFTAVAGEKVRVVLTYLSHTSSAAPYNTDLIKSNLDLKVNTAGNQEIGVSIRTADNWEIAEFTAVDTGLHKIRVIRGPSSTNDNELLGIAWSRITTYLPDVRAQNGWNSTIYVRNDDAQPANAFVTFMNSDGTVNGVPSGHIISANGVWSFTPPSNWSGSAVVDGSEDLSVVIGQVQSNGRAILDTGFRANANDSAFEQTATTLYGPLGYKAIFGNYTSKLSIQNVGTVSTGVTAYLKGRQNGSPVYGDYQLSTVIAAAGTGIINLGSLSGYGVNEWAGSVTIVSNSTPKQPLTAKIVTDNGTVQRSYAAGAGGKTILYAPSAYKNAFSINTGIVIQNLSDVQSTDVTVIYCERTVTNFAACPSQVISSLTAGRAVGIYLGTSALLPASWTGTIKAQSSNGVALAMVVSNNVAADTAEYNASGSGGRLVYLPHAKRNVNGNSSDYTGWIVRNVAGVTINVTAYYFDSAGNPSWTQPTFTLQAAQAAGFSQKDQANLSSGWNGSILLAADGAMLAVVQENGVSSYAAYNGIVR